MFGLAWLCALKNETQEGKHTRVVPLDPCHRLAARLNFRSDDKNMAPGTVKWFTTTKGYGFIVPQDGGKDVFVHITAVQSAGLRGMGEGQKGTLHVRLDGGKGA